MFKGIVHPNIFYSLTLMSFQTCNKSFLYCDVEMFREMSTMLFYMQCKRMVAVKNEQRHDT